MHHAYLILGTPEDAQLRAFELFKVATADREGNPDLQVLTYTTLGIDDARQLRVWAMQEPVRGGRRMFILHAEQLLHEAQNALLKLFEEPPEKSAFALIMPSVDRILPTLRSRMEIIELEILSEQEVAKNFLKKNLGERLKEVRDRLKDKDGAWIESLLASLEREAHEKKDRDAMHALLFTRTYLSRRGASPKMLLEYLALSL